MGSVIHKHPLNTVGHYVEYVEVKMVAGAEVLCVKEVDGIVCLYEKHNAELVDRQRRVFAVIGTGDTFTFAKDLRGNYLGTGTQKMQSVRLGADISPRQVTFAWHVFELVPY